MGYFAYLYLLEGQSHKHKDVNLVTTIFEGESGNIPYFSWIPGERSSELHPYASNTVYSDVKLQILPGYPIANMQKLGERTGYIPSILIEAQFNPNVPRAGIVLHVILPERYIPRRDLSPLVQPISPYVKLDGDRMALTWPIEGAFDVRFCATPLTENESYDDFDVSKILVTEESRNPKLGVEINLGVIKFKFGN